MVKFLVGIGILYIVYGTLLFSLQRRILFPRFLVGAPPENLTLPSGVNVVWIKASFGDVEAYWMPPESPEAKKLFPAALFAHGNGERIDFWPEALSPFIRMGVGVLMVEYPGYGRSAGSPSQETVTEVLVRAYDFIASRKEVDPNRIVFIGRSLGGGAVCALAQKRKADALILMSTFTGIRTLTSRYLLPAALVRDPFDNLAVVREFKGPILIIHGNRDETIPFQHGVTLFKNAKNAKMIPYTAGHNDCPPDWGDFFREVEAFLVSSRILSLT